MDFDRLREKPRPRRELIPAHARFAKACAVFTLWASLAFANAETLRVVTYNVEAGLGTLGSPVFENAAQDLQRLGADVVGFQELLPDRADDPNLESMGSWLGLPHKVTTNSSDISVGLLSRHPVAESHWINEDGMWRPILLARIDVSPATSRKVWVAVLHLMCCNRAGNNSERRSFDLNKLRQAILARCDPAHDLIILMGDFNLVAPGEDANNFFVPEQIFKLDARHAGTGETWTWSKNSSAFCPSPLDHIMVNARVRSTGVASEVYDVKKDAQGMNGLPKPGPLPTSPEAYRSDHLPVFADLYLDESGTSEPFLAVSDSFALDAESVPRLTPDYPNGGYVLTNMGAQTLHWTASKTAPWVSLSSESGMLGPGEGVYIQASFNSNIQSLPLGQHVSSVTFTNETNGNGGKQASASLFVSPFTMDGNPEPVGYSLQSSGLSLRAAVVGTRLYVATQSTGNQAGGNDHHIIISDELLSFASVNASWAKRGKIAVPEYAPYLAAEGTNKYVGWFNAEIFAKLHRGPENTGVLEGSIDLIEEFCQLPEYLYIAVVAYETANASSANPQLGRVVGQVPAANVNDNNITPDEFLRIPVRNIRDSAGDGRFDIHVPGRAFQPTFQAGAQGLNLRWPASPEKTYRVWHRERLETGAWQVLEEITTGARDWEAALENPGATSSSGSGFYRIELLAP